MRQHLRKQLHGVGPQRGLFGIERRRHLFGQFMLVVLDVSILSIAVETSDHSATSLQLRHCESKGVGHMRIRTFTAHRSTMSTVTLSRLRRNRGVQRLGWGRRSRAATQQRE